MLMSGKLSVKELKYVDIPYYEVPEDEKWKIEFVKELLEIKHGDTNLPGWEQEELDYILNYLCTG